MNANCFKYTILYGFRNIGNRCYLNSVIQLLFSIKPILNLNKSENDIIIDEKNEFIQSFLELGDMYFEKLEIKPKSSYTVINKFNAIDEDNVLDTDNIYEVLDKTYKLDNFQHDAHEILHYIIEILDKTVKLKNKKEILFNKNFNDTILKISQKKWVTQNNFSIISKTFKGQSRDKITCGKCFIEKNIFNSFVDISINIVNNSIKESMDNFCKTETVNYFCEFCKTENPSTKVVSFTILPDFLILHLKRFEYDIESNTIIKDNATIKDISDVQTLESLENPKTKYTMLSCIEHIGENSDFGHYITYNNSFKENIVLFDDETVINTTKENICKSPYIIILQKNE